MEAAGKELNATWSDEAREAAAEARRAKASGGFGKGQDTRALFDGLTTRKPAGKELLATWSDQAREAAKEARQEHANGPVHPAMHKALTSRGYEFVENSDTGESKYYHPDPGVSHRSVHVAPSGKWHAPGYSTITDSGEKTIARAASGNGADSSLGQLKGGWKGGSFFPSKK